MTTSALGKLSTFSICVDARRARRRSSPRMSRPRLVHLDREDGVEAAGVDEPARHAAAAGEEVHESTDRAPSHGPILRSATDVLPSAGTAPRRAVSARQDGSSKPAPLACERL